MNNYVLTCCSTADLSKEHFEKRNIQVVYFHFELDGVEYLDDCGASMPPEELFRRMDAGADTKTSQVSVAEYTDFWKKYLEQGLDILHVTLSSGISGTYQSAMIAKEDLAELYPDRKILVVDSLAASSGYGLLMDKLADLRDGGMGIEDLYAWAEDNKRRLHHWFYTNDLTYFIRGGRVSKTAGMVGQLLSICPLLNVDHQGRLTPREKIRGVKKVMQRTVDVMEAHAQGGKAYNGKCYICQSLREEQAADIAGMIEARFPELDGKVQIYPIGATIGSHTGPGTIAVFFWGDRRED